MSTSVTRKRSLRALMVVALLASVLVVMPIGSAGAVPGADSTVFINELHYDNGGTDAGEAIEVAGPAGTDLSGWSLVLYNGNGGAVYNTTTLSGSLGDLGDGYGVTVVDYPVNGIQNGAPDGIALVDDGGAVVQFLSYEGTFTATDGPASGLTSTDIGVSESSATPVGDSLQLAGTGATAGDFTWATEAPNTFGAANTGQTFVGGTPVYPDLFVNELHYDNAGTDAGEGVEVAGPAGSDLSGWSVVFYNGNGGTTYATLSLSGVIPDQNGGYGTLEFPQSGIQNGAPDGFALVDPASAVVQFLSYEGTFTATDGPASGLTSTDIGVAESSSTPVGDSLQLTGTGTAYADFTWAEASPETFGAVNTGQNFGTPVLASPFVNELHYDNAGTDTGEGVEVAGPAGSDLSGWSVVFYNGNGGAPYATLNLSGTLPDQDGGYGTLEFPQAGIQNGSPDGFALVDPADGVVEFLSYEGTFTAVGGPADGMTSTDIGVSQGSSTPVGSSLQLIGTGTTAADFTWAPEMPETFGAVNTGQSFGGVVDLPVEAFCNGPLLVLTGDAGSVDVTATDPDETVVDISGVVNGDPAPGTIEVGPTTPASGPGGTATATVSVSDTVAAGSYTVDITATNDADPLGPGDTDACTLDISVVDVAGITPIHDVQGPGLVSPLEGMDVVISGIVVADFQGDAALNGFFVQEEDADADADPATSEGIFVNDFFDVPDVDVSIGDLVIVEGTVQEFFNRTQLSFVTVGKLSSGNTLPTPATVTLPVTSIDDFEPFEGMSLVMPQDLTISEYFNFDRFGEIVLTTGRHNQPTAIFEPGSVEAAELAAANALDRLTLDDGRRSQNPDPAIHPNGLEFTLDNLFRGGDLVSNVTGVMDFNFGNYKVQPTAGADYVVTNPRQLAPDDVGGTMEVAAFNVLNYFSTLDDSGPICGPLGDQGCRGADNANEFTRQRDKIFEALADIDADVVGLIEIENHATDEALIDLVDGLNAVVGAGTYDYVATGPAGPDVIKVAFIYKPATVALVGAPAVLDDPAFLDPRGYGDAKNRAAVAQTFEEIGSGDPVTVVVNHLKSKGTPCGDPVDDDPETGSCNLTRTLAAEALADWMATDPTGSGDGDVLIIGDLNAYDKEDPIDALRRGADDIAGTADDYTDLVLRDLGEEAYSYVFSGQWGYLDYAMAITETAAKVNDTTVWHINADEPDILDYDTTFKKPAQQALYEKNAFRSSDHDPVIVGLAMAETPIFEIQGDGFVSPYEGEIVKTSGVVTGDFQGDDALRGFYAQDGDGDGDPATSDGIFVFDRFSSDVDVNVGDLVEIIGEVDEFFGETQLTDVTVTILGTDGVPPTAIAMPVTDQADFEAYEGMLVTFPQALSATDHFNLHRFGEVDLAAGGRQFQPTNVVSPVFPFDDNGISSVADILEPYRILLDDGNRNQFPDEVPYLRPPGTLRLGDTVTGLTGNMAFSFSRYRINPTQDVEFAPVNLRPGEVAPDVGGDLRVATYNLLNYWTTIDDGSIPFPDSPRGADSDAEFERQQAKAVRAILAMDAQIIGLQELENNGPTAIGDLVNALNDATAPGTWAAVPDAAYPGGIEGTNAIKVGIIYQPAVVAPLGLPVADPAPVFAEDRPPVAQTFVADGEVFTVMVNHFKSKGCSDATGGDTDQNDGQGCYNERRTNQAAAVLDFVTKLQAATGDDDVLVIGDLNSYLAEDPITELDTGLDNLVDAYVDPTDQYSFVFFGMAGMLDYAFSTQALTSKVTGTAVWHINADEPRVLDYNDDIVDPGERSSEFMQELFDPNIVYRSSDHDPVIVGLELGGTSAKDLKREAEAKVADLIPSGDSVVDESLSFAESRISQSLRSTYWRNANALRNNGAAVFTHEWNAASALDPIAAGEGSTAIGAGAAESKLVAADYLLARYELERAIAASGNPAKIAEAEDAFASGEAAMAAGDYLAAISYYRWAWIRARQAT